MGFMGLSHPVESDMASELAGLVIDAQMDLLNKELTVDHGRYNTTGFQNVCMFMAAFIFPGRAQYALMSNEKLLKMTDHLLKHLPTQIETASKAEWDSGNNKQEHLDALKDWQEKLMILKDYLTLGWSPNEDKGSIRTQVQQGTTATLSR